jgi:large subunit ribosomal protein L6
MSRIGMRPVALPQGVKVIIKDGVFSVEGPKGKLEQSFVREVEFKVGPSEVVVSRLGPITGSTAISSTTWF